jgi:hypothetical protein
MDKKLKENCKAEVYDPLRWKHFGCRRKASKDGFCKQHHPDSVAERQRKRDEKYELEQQKSPWATIEKLKNRIAELEAAQKAVVDAWVIEGPHPEHHDRWCQNLIVNWPALANAVKNLVRKHKGGD